MGTHLGRAPVPRTSSRRGKRLKACHMCRRCRREWRHYYRSIKFGGGFKLGKSLRFHCNGVWDT